MTTAAANHIHLEGPIGQREELVAASGSAIMPGMLVRRTTATQCNVHATSGGNGAALLAHSDEFQGDATTGGGVTKVYTVGTPVFAEYVLPGALKYVLLKASENVSIGDFLISGGDGTFIKTAGTPSRQFCIAEEASNVGTTNLIMARFI